MQYVHTVEYCLAIKINEVLTHAITWKNLEKMLTKKTITKDHILNDSFHMKYPD